MIAGRDVPVDASVLVGSVNGGEWIHVLLEALEAQRTSRPFEVIVADRTSDGTRGRIEREHPRVQVLAAAPGATLPELRTQALEAARGRHVFVTEDHTVPPLDWIERFASALDAAPDTIVAVGGPVDNLMVGGSVDWAAFLCEYSHCLPPLPAGEVGWLTGNNVVYPRELLARYQSVIDRGGWENLLHDAFRNDGIPLVCHPEIEVSHKKHYTVGEYASQRYLYSRSYAGVRFPNASLGARLARSLAAMALPPILFARTVSRVMPKRRFRGELVRSLPLLVVFVTAWAAGEVVGYLAGPGDSLARVC